MTISSIKRETSFLLRQPFMPLLFLLTALLSAYAVTTGVLDVREQRATIDRLLAADALDREDALKKQSDYGGAAYYQFHLTYDPPSDLTFAAFGERDVYPWKHRVRMLALEGQIYETDAANPELAFAGRLDFNFIVSVLAPLFVILLLHDLKAGERAVGRYNILVATTGDDHRLWLARAAARMVLLLACLLVPFWVGAGISGTAALDVLLVSLAVVAYVAFWAAVTYFAASRQASAPAIASGLLGVWLLLTFLVPSLGKLAIEEAVPAPNGGNIVLVQREAVNDAWDLPKPATMRPFVARHPEWADKAEIDGAFEWKWYYAFQQVGDQKAERLSLAYRDAVRERDKLAGLVAYICPPALMQRFLAHRAGTDVQAALDYEARVRAFHASLRNFYYPFLFEGRPYDAAVFKDLPEYDPTLDEEMNRAS